MRSATSPWRQGIGAYGENVACRLLAEKGMTILERNWRCPTGEIDIVARDGDDLVVCEVKTRRDDSFGGARAAVTWRKIRRLRQLAAAWLAAHPDVHPDLVRIDVVAVTRPARGAALVEHFEGV